MKEKIRKLLEEYESDFFWKMSGIDRDDLAAYLATHLEEENDELHRVVETAGKEA